MDTIGPNITAIIKGEIMEVPMLVRPDQSWIFYIIMDCPEGWMRVLLLQANDSVEEIKPWAQ